MIELSDTPCSNWAQLDPAIRGLPKSVNRLTRYHRLAAFLGTSVSKARSAYKNQTGRRRINLWLRGPHCHWCGRLTTLDFCPDGRNQRDTATIDHLKSRPAGRALHERTAIVLACHSCNTQRNDMEQKLAKGKRVHIDLLRRFLVGLDGDGI